MDCEIITFEVEIKVFFPLCPIGKADFDRLFYKKINYVFLGFCTIVMHIMLGTCIPNLRNR
jgi:hypothetical protein